MQVLDRQGNVGGLLHSNWKAFYFTEVFTQIQRGKRLKKADHKVGDTPYVSSTSFNNGVDGFICNDGGVRKFKDSWNSRLFDLNLSNKVAGKIMGISTSIPELISAIVASTSGLLMITSFNIISSKYKCRQ